MTYKRLPIPKAVRERVRNRFDGRCGYCGEISSKLCIDHIKSVAHSYRDPEKANDESNLMPACFSCNNMKTVYSLEEFRADLEAQLSRANEYSVNYRFAKRFGQVQETPSPIVFYFEKKGIR